MYSSKGKVLFIILAMSFFAIPSLAGASGLAERIQSAYKGLRDVKGTFVQKSFMESLKKETVYKGNFEIKFPSRMRYVYTGNSSDEVIINKGSILIYQKKENQVLKGSFDSSTYGAAPVAFLGGLGDLKKDFNVSEEKGKKLILRPKGQLEGVRYIEVEPSEGGQFPIKSFILHDKYSNTVRISLEDVKANTGVRNSDFVFTPPKGVNIYDYNR
ncbi:MAG: outer membrane lipoprotein carrier protein LolA [Nitrospiraceae bacterium]|nr:outer membrane lipoprotein carrier protein LolA [Nitrospiraceae bacterium]